MVFITDHGQRLSHSVFDTFYASISTGVISRVGCIRRSLSECRMGSIMGQEGGWASP